MERPKVGVGVFIRYNGKILLGKRIGAHGANSWCPPGGHLEGGESWEECAIRETLEETGLKIHNVKLGTVTNDIHTKEGKHYITLIMTADLLEGTPERKEPEKCLEWKWFSWDNVPKELFLPVENARKSGFNPFK